MAVEGFDRRPWGRLDGKVVMVTGASSGIGRDLCLDLAKAGCRVVAAARRADRLKTLCDEIRAFRPDDPASAAVAVVLDVGAEEAAVSAAVRKAWDAFGRIDGLVNNAGVRGAVNSSLNWSQEEWDSVVKTNLTGLWLVSKHVCRLMRDDKLNGSVINVSSIGGLRRGYNLGAIAYNASKSAVHTVTEVMALDLGAYNIRVNAIAPGLFKSEITTSLIEKKWLSRVAERTVPLRTFGTTDPAITTLVRYLLHDSSKYISGNVFVADAGTALPGIPIFSSL